MTITRPTLIGLSGVARSGKDTVADILHQLYGFEAVSFSDLLNEALLALNPWLSFTQDFGRVTEVVRYADYVEEHGYEAAKEVAEVRRLLQAMGTEVGRNLLGENIWVDALFENLPPGRVAITNVRFPNEYDAVKDHGGVVWRVTRPGFAASNGHVSDTALDDHEFDHHLVNDTSIRDLAFKVIDALEQPLANSAHNEGVRA